MTLRLPRLDVGVPIVTPQGTPTVVLLKWWDEVATAIEAQEAAQDATLNRIRRINSHTDPTSVLSATENGASVTIEVLDHTRVYADGTEVEIEGNTTDGTGLLPETMYGCYYDDETLADTTPAFVFTTDIALAQAARADGRHWCGALFTPALGSGDTVLSGGAYPMGSMIGGELD